MINPNDPDYLEVKKSIENNQLLPLPESVSYP